MQAVFRFRGELRDFLPATSRTKDILYPFRIAGSVKDAIEALGVPHPEVGALTVNGSDAPLSRLIADGDLIEVFPYGAADPVQRGPASCRPPGEPLFVLDVHLGTLARYLRMLGFDTLYRNDSADEELATLSAQQTRILLTRDVGLLKRSVVEYGHFMRAVRPHAQLEETVRRYELKEWAKPFTRCIACNGLLSPASKQAVLILLPEHVAEVFHDFKQCDSCKRVYWEGSHMRRMRELVQSAVGIAC